MPCFGRCWLTDGTKSVGQQAGNSEDILPNFGRPASGADHEIACTRDCVQTRPPFGPKGIASLKSGARSVAPMPAYAAQTRFSRGATKSEECAVATKRSKWRETYIRLAPSFVKLLRYLRRKPTSPADPAPAAQSLSRGSSQSPKSNLDTESAFVCAPTEMFSEPTTSVHVTRRGRREVRPQRVFQKYVTLTIEYPWPSRWPICLAP